MCCCCWDGFASSLKQFFFLITPQDIKHRGLSWFLSSSTLSFILCDVYIEKDLFSFPYKSLSFVFFSFLLLFPLNRCKTVFFSLLPFYWWLSLHCAMFFLTSSFSFFFRFFLLLNSFEFWYCFVAFVRFKIPYIHLNNFYVEPVIAVCNCVVSCRSFATAKQTGAIRF